jgi:hypothetical protein
LILAVPRALQPEIVEAQSLLLASHITMHLPLDTLVVCCTDCSVQDLYSNLAPEAAASLSGVAGAAQLKQAGYTALAVQAGAPDGAISMWNLKLAGYLPGGVAGTAGVGSSNGERHRSRSRSFNGGSAAAAASTGSAQQQPASGDAGGQNACGQIQQQQQQQQLLRADAPGDVEYFRQQVKPLMQMQPDNDLPHLLIGTKVIASLMRAAVG